jgi:hypothetical protein
MGGGGRGENGGRYQTQTIRLSHCEKELQQLRD